MNRLVTALDLLPGDRVEDDFTAWAEVRAVGHVAFGVRVVWRLANGQPETTTYDRCAQFTLLTRPHGTCEGMGDPY